MSPGEGWLHGTVDALESPQGAGQPTLRRLSCCKLARETDESGVRCRRSRHGPMTLPCVPRRRLVHGLVDVLDSHEQGVDRLEEQHFYVAHTSFGARGVCDRNVLRVASPVSPKT